MRYGVMIVVGGVLGVLGMAAVAAAYPADGYETTGIRRLEWVNRIVSGEIRGTRPVPGALKPSADIRLNLTAGRGDALDPLPSPDPGFQRAVDALFPNRHESYSLAVLDITPGRPIRFAERQADRSFSPGSVGKLAITAGVFAELKRLFPADPEKRRQLMRDHMVIADRFIRHDHHQVPIFDPRSNGFTRREVREGDVFSLYEWIDHMMSASANSAASTVWKEAMLMRHFGAAYPPTSAEATAFFNTTPKETLKAIAMSVVNDPLRGAGIDEHEWHLGSFFTSEGKRIVPGAGGSRATPRGLLKYLVAIERGRMIDMWSSLEIKRLLYMTDRRIRYASSPALNRAAVYFKSGSLYKCRNEAGFRCGKYKGNVFNYMNSVAIVEQPDGRTYLVGFMSNVLRKNSAVEHQTIATYLDRIIK